MLRQPKRLTGPHEERENRGSKWLSDGFRFLSLDMNTRNGLAQDQLRSRKLTRLITVQHNMHL